MLELRQLRYFIAVAETENVGRAAELLHISQSPLSRQIRQLEEQLGVQLFERHKQRIRLTSEGRDLLGEARALLHNAQRVESFGRRLGTGAAGRLAIGYVEAALHAQVLGGALRRLRAHSPSVSLSLQALGTAQQFEQLHLRTLDAALVYRAPEAGSGLTSVPVLDEPLVLAVPPGDPLARCRTVRPAQLDGRGWICVVRQPVDTIRASLLAACQRSGFTPDIVYEVPDPLSSLHLVDAGLGLAVVQEALRHKAPSGVVFKAVPWLDLRVHLHLAWRSDEQRPLVAAFRQAVLGSGGAS